MKKLCRFGRLSILAFCFLLTACSENQKEITRQCEKLVKQLNSADQSNHKELSKLSQQLIETASRIHSPKDRQFYEGLAYFDLGQIQSDKKDFKKADEYYRKSFSVLSNDSIREVGTKVVAALEIAKYQMKQKNKKEMLHWIHLADKAFSQLKRHPLNADYDDAYVIFYTEIGFILYDADEFDRAEAESDKASVMYQKKPNELKINTLSPLFYLKGIIAFQKNKYDDCIQYMKFAIDNFHDKKGHISFGYHSYIVNSYLCKKDFPAALDFTNRLMQDDSLYPKDKNRKQMICYYFLAKIHDATGNPVEAKKYAKLAMNFNSLDHKNKIIMNNILEK